MLEDLSKYIAINKFNGNTNWSYLYWDKWQWIVDHEEGQIPLENIRDKVKLIERPGLFVDNKSYTNWLDFNDIHLFQYERNYIEEKPRYKEYCWVRCPRNSAAPPYPGGYKLLVRFSKPNDYFITLTDGDDGCWDWSTKSKSESNEIWDYLMIPDLTFDDLLEIKKLYEQS